MPILLQPRFLPVVLLLVPVMLLVTGCLPSKARKPDKPVYQEPAERDCEGWCEGKVITGTASWYGPNFHGKKTANGETYDMNGYSAAHKKMPLGSIVKVENTTTGATVIVKVNDRGPYVDDRVMDMSKGAAQSLGMIATGTAQIKAKVLHVGDGTYYKEGEAPTAFNGVWNGQGPQSQQPTAADSISEDEDASPKASGIGRILVGTYDSRVSAERMYYWLRGRFKVKIEGENGSYRVIIHKFKSEKSRKRSYKRLKREGYDVELIP